MRTVTTVCIGNLLGVNTDLRVGLEAPCAGQVLPDAEKRPLAQFEKCKHIPDARSMDICFLPATMGWLGSHQNGIAETRAVFLLLTHQLIVQEIYGSR